MVRIVAAIAATRQGRGPWGAAGPVRKGLAAPTILEKVERDRAPREKYSWRLRPMTTPVHRPFRPDDALDDGIRAAFGEAPATRPSVLRLLQQKAGSSLDLHFHDVDGGSDVPVKMDDDAKALRDPSGRYQILGEIGRGGVGVVYKGRDQDLGRDVAMKVLRAEHADRPEILERFVEEAQIAGQLQHPGIVPVYELGLQHGERPYFAMKLVKGETLAVLLSRRTDPSEERRR